MLAGAITATTAAASAEVKSGDRAPSLSGVTSARGNQLSLATYRGRWVVLTFGASWCEPCKLELPAWDRLAAAYRRARSKVVFVAVNIDEDAETGRSFLTSLRLRHVCVGFDPGRVAVAAYDPGTMPTTYLIDPTGVVRYVHLGYRAGDERRLRARVDALIK